MSRPKGSKNKKLRPNYYETHGDISILVVESFKGTTYKFLIDTEDLPLVKEYRWHAVVSNTGYGTYAATKKEETLLLHRLLTNFKFEKVDHIDRDTFDNRKSNLRETTSSNNNANGCSRYSDEMRGARPSRNGKFTSRITKDGKMYHLGTFETMEEAHKMYVEKHKELFKEHSIFN